MSHLIHEEKEKKGSKIRRKLRIFEMGLSRENLKGLILALVSSGFIGASFIIKKQGLRRAAAVSGVRAGGGVFSIIISIWKLVFGYAWFCNFFFSFCRCWWLLLSLGATMVGGNDHK